MFLAVAQHVDADALQMRFVLQACAHLQASQQHSNDSLAASCDRTHLYVIWGLTPLPPALTPATTTPPVGQASGSQTEAAGSSQRLHRGTLGDSVQAGSSRSHSAAGGPDESGAAAAQNTDHNLTDRDSVLRHGDFRGLTGPDDLVASLRRLRPHLHASEPFKPHTAGAAAAQHASAPTPANRSSAPSDGTTGLATAQTGCGATGSGKGSDVHASVEFGLSGSTEHVANVGMSDGKEAAGSSTADIQGQRDMPAVDPQQAQHDGLGLSGGGHQSASSQAAASLAGVATTEQKRPESSCSADEAQHAQHGIACPPWPILKAAHTAQQLRAIHQCCNTVACFDIFETMPSTANQCQSRQPKGENPAHQGREEQPQQHQGCRAQPLWSHAVIAAAHLSAGDGAVAVACSDGMLLLLAQASGSLIR